MDVRAELNELRKSLVELIDEYLLLCIITLDVKRFERFARTVRDHIREESERRLLNNDPC